MSFPTAIEPRAIKQLLNFALGTDKDPGRAALAVYDVVGFGLGQIFKDAVYLTTALEEENVQLTDDQKLMLTTMASAKSEEELKAMGPLLLIFLQTLGPVLLKIILKRLGLSEIPLANPTV